MNRNLSVLLAAANVVNGALALSQLVRNEDDAEECHWTTFTTVDIAIEELSDNMDGLDEFDIHANSKAQLMCCAYIYTKLRRAMGDSWQIICLDVNNVIGRLMTQDSYEHVMGTLMAMEEECNVENTDTHDMLLTLKRLSQRQYSDEIQSMIDTLAKLIDPSTTHLRSLN